MSGNSVLKLSFRLSLGVDVEDSLVYLGLSRRGLPRQYIKMGRDPKGEGWTSGKKKYQCVVEHEKYKFLQRMLMSDKVKDGNLLWMFGEYAVVVTVLVDFEGVCGNNFGFQVVANALLCLTSEGKSETFLVGDDGCETNGVVSAVYEKCKDLPSTNFFAQCGGVDLGSTYMGASLAPDHWFNERVDPVRTRCLNFGRKGFFPIATPYLFMSHVKFSEVKTPASYFYAGFLFARVLHFESVEPRVKLFWHDISAAKRVLLLIPAMFCFFVWSTPYAGDLSLKVGGFKKSDEWSLSTDGPFNVTANDCESRAMTVFRLMHEFMSMDENHLAALPENERVVLLFVQSIMRRMRVLFCVGSCVCEHSLTTAEMLCDPFEKVRADEELRQRIKLGGHAFLRLEFVVLDEHTRELQRYLELMVHTELLMFLSKSSSSKMGKSLDMGEVCLDVETTYPWFYYGLAWRNLRKLYPEEKHLEDRGKRVGACRLTRLMLEGCEHQHNVTKMVSCVVPMTLLAGKTYHVSMCVGMKEWGILTPRFMQSFLCESVHFDGKRGEPYYPCRMMAHNFQGRPYHVDDDLVRAFVEFMPEGNALELDEPKARETIKVLRELGETTRDCMSKGDDKYYPVFVLHRMHKFSETSLLGGERYVHASNGTYVSVQLTAINHQLYKRAD